MNVYFDQHTKCVRLTLTYLLITTANFFDPAQGSYDNETRLFRDKLGPASDYNKVVRPVLNTSHVITVNVSFYLVAIVDVDAIKQQFIINGFLASVWTDEKIRWSPGEYGGLEIIHPDPDQIWKPRMILANTLVARDLFEDSYCPITVKESGFVAWVPGSLFPSSCKLNLYKFPFDVQHCYIEMMANSYVPSELIFSPLTGEIDFEYFVESGEWTIVNTSIIAKNDHPQRLSSFRINFVLKRRPGYFVINIVTPVVLLSFLNILVFLIPGESGEKISYGITVLLAVTLFMSIVSGQVPRSSDTLPLVTIYLLILVVISVCTVCVSILTVYLQHREEKETRHNKAICNFKSLFKKSTVLNQTASAFKDKGDNSNVPKNQVSAMKTDSETREKSSAEKAEMMLNLMQVWRESAKSPEDTYHYFQKEATGSDAAASNRWRQIGKHINCISFLVFLCLWLSTTIGFLVEISRSD